MAYCNGRILPGNFQPPPVVSELEAIFAELPDEELLTKLRGPRRRGPKGYNPEILWHCYVAFYYLGLPSVSDLIRTFHDNPFIAAACGIESQDKIPSQPTFSRFFARLSRPSYVWAVKNIVRELTRHMYKTFPDFGKSVAIDSTDIKAWSNGAKKNRDGEMSDPDAGWCVKRNTEGKSKYVWGYKVHILADTNYELPLIIDVTAGNVHDVTRAAPLLYQLRKYQRGFMPDYVICDAAYSSIKLRRIIKNQFRAEPIIDPNPSHKRAVAQDVKTAEWRMIYNRRTALERLNARLKAHRRLNSLRVRGRWKVTVHVLLSIMVCQVQALVMESRVCVRKVA